MTPYNTRICRTSTLAIETADWVSSTACALELTEISDVWVRDLIVFCQLGQVQEAEAGNSASAMFIFVSVTIAILYNKGPTRIVHRHIHFEA